jgi:hypothetical protein
MIVLIKGRVNNHQTGTKTYLKLLKRNSEANLMGDLQLQGNYLARPLFIRSTQRSLIKFLQKYIPFKLTLSSRYVFILSIL